MAVFTRRYASFKELLRPTPILRAFCLSGRGAARRRSLEISPCSKEARRAIFQCERMADCLNDIAAQRHAELGVVVDRISERIVRELEQHARGDVTSLTLPLSEVDASMAYSVGGQKRQSRRIAQYAGYARAAGLCGDHPGQRPVFAP